MVEVQKVVPGVGFELTEDQKMLQRMAREFTTKEIIPVAEHFDRDAIFPEEIFHKARELGIVNMNIPAEYGGVGATVFEECLVGEELGYGCTGISISITTNPIPCAIIPAPPIRPGPGANAMGLAAAIPNVTRM